MKDRVVAPDLFRRLQGNSRLGSRSGCGANGRKYEKRSTGMPARLVGIKSRQDSDTCSSLTLRFRDRSVNAVAHSVVFILAGMY